VYLKEALPDKKTDDGRQTYKCAIHEVCTKTGLNFPYASCEDCCERLTLDAKCFDKRFQDDLVIQDWCGVKTHALRNLLANGTAFLVAGGPSARQLDLSKIEQRGIFSLAVNNMAAYYRASAFICADPPSKFHNGIWQDPRVMKFVPTPKMRVNRGGLRKKEDGSFQQLFINGNKVSACHCPNVWGFGRRSWLIPDESFFLDDHAAWGNLDAGVKKTGGMKTVCTLLLAIRVLYYLGARRIYLVGVDMYMDPRRDLHDNYAFREVRDEGAVRSNNNQYKIVNQWLCEMQQKGIFSKFGLEIFNCNQNSHLAAFDYAPFDLAVEDALQFFPKEPFDCDGWYFKEKKKKNRRRKK